MATYADDEGRVLSYQVKQSIRRLDKLEEWRQLVDAYVAADKEQKKGMEEDLHTLLDKIDGLYKMLLVTALTLAGSSVTFALTALTIKGKL